MIESHVMIWFHHKQIWCENMWFDLDFIWIYHDLISDFNKSQVSVMDWSSRTQCSTMTYADNYSPNQTVRQKTRR